MVAICFGNGITNRGALDVYRVTVRIDCNTVPRELCVDNKCECVYTGIHYLDQRLVSPMNRLAFTRSVR